MVRGGSNFLGRIDGVPAKRGFRVSWGPWAARPRPTLRPDQHPVPHGPAHGNTHAYQISALLIAAAVPIATGYSGDALHTPFTAAART
jgi:hypothetical protein